MVWICGARRLLTKPFVPARGLASWLGVDPGAASPAALLGAGVRGRRRASLQKGAGRGKGSWGAVMPRVGRLKAAMVRVEKALGLANGAPMLFYNICRSGRKARVWDATNQ